MLTSTVQELTDALIQVWEENPQDTIHQLINGWCLEYIEERGGAYGHMHIMSGFD